MQIRPTLSFYISRQFMTSFLALLAIILSIIFLLDLVELLRRAADRPDVTMGNILHLALLKLPDTGQDAIPFMVLFSAIHALWRLTRSQELIVVRASGVSAWQILTPVLVSAFLIGVVAVAVINPVSSVLIAKFAQLDRSIMGGRTTAFSIAKSGLWVRQSMPEGGYALINAEKISARTRKMTPVIVLFFDKDEKYKGRIDAESASLVPKKWVLKGATISEDKKPSQFQETYNLPSDLTLDRLEDSFAAPETLSFWQLPHFIKMLEDTGFSAVRHRIHFQHLLSLPLLLCAMILLAATFSLRYLRQGGVTGMIVAGIATGFSVFLINDVSVAFGLSGSVPPLMAAWTPAIAATMLGVAALLHQEDS